MKIDDLTIGDAKKISALFSLALEPDNETRGEGIQIVVLQRGWVVVGALFKTGSEYSLTGGSVIRNWGTTKGLGEIAIEGPLSATKLDPIPDASFHELTVVLKMKCSAKWDGLCKNR